MRADLRADPVKVESRTSVLGKNRESARRMVGSRMNWGASGRPWTLERMLAGGRNLAPALLLHRCASCCCWW
jgi:hypothetical protein